MSVVIDLDGPYGKTFSILGVVKQTLIDEGRGDEVPYFLADVTAKGYDGLMEVASKYVDIDWEKISEA